MIGGLALALAVENPSLVGSWAYVEAHRDASLPVEACGTDFGVTYAPDGTFLDAGGERGVWRMRGTRLFKRVTHVWPETAVVERAVDRRPATSVLTWLSPDHVNEKVNRQRFGLVRCP